MTREQILAVYNAGPVAMITLVESMSKSFELQLAVLEERIKQLESQLNQNSKNSSKPPSSDGFKKTKSQRKKSGKKSGAQKGHPGHTLEITPNPDQVQVHKIKQCQACGVSLADQPADSFERRQVFDMPPLHLFVAEHRAERKTCPICGVCNKASFPAEVTQPVQYGPGVKALAVYLNQYQFIPYERTAELFKDLFDQSFSEGALFTANQVCFEALADTEQSIKQGLLNSPVIHCDETGSRVEGKTYWLHTASTLDLTYYSIHPKRGSDAMDEMGILPFYNGIAKHDFWKAYFKYSSGHSLCNDHHLRELTWVIENEKQTWAQQMHDLLLEIKAAVDRAKENAKTRLELEQLMDFEMRYDNIIAHGYRENPFFEVWEPNGKGKRGKLKKSKARNLLERLDKHRTKTFDFMFDFRIPFGNNQAERDIRMTKVQQKISGGFRSLQGAKIFCRIRGYISTVKKNSVPVLGAIRDAFCGNPFVPSCV